MKPEIEREYAEQMAIRTFSERADEFTNMVYEQSDSLEPTAQKFGLKVETVDFVTRNGVTDPELGRIINDRVAEALFGSECLKEKRNSNAIEVQSNTLVAARVVEYYPEKERALDDVKSIIGEKLRSQKAAEKAFEAGKAKLAELQNSKSLEGFTDEVWVSRQNQQGQETALINAELALESAKLPAYTGATLANGSYAIAYVEAARTHQANEAELRGLARELGSFYGEADRAGYLEALKEAIGTKVLRPDFVKGEEKPAEQE